MLNKQKRLLKPHTKLYIAPALTQKLFSNMKRDSKGYTGVNIPLFPTMIIQGPVVQGKGSTYPVESHHTPTSAPSTSQPPISPTTRRTIRQKFVVSQPRSPTQTPVADETVHEERGDSVERAATTSASLDAEQDSGGSPKRQKTTLRGMPAQTRFERLSKQPHDSPLPRVNTLGSDEGSLKLQELTVLCIKLSTKVDSLEADLKQTKQIYGAAFTKLIKKVKTLEKIVKSIQARRKDRIIVSGDEEDLEDPSKQGRKIAEIDEDPNISLVQHDAEVRGRHEHDMDPDFEFTTAKEVYTAKKGVSTAEPVSTAGASLAKDKGKALRLQAEIDEEERQRIARVQEEASSFNIEEWDDIQARVEADEEFALRLQSEEKEMYSEAEKAILLAELINVRKRYFAAERAEERRNKPITQAQQRTYMRVHTFVPIESESERVIPELAARSSKRDAEEELVQERINVEALQTKYPIIDWEIYTEGARKYWKIIRVGNHTEVYQFFDDMLKAFDREDLVKLWSLVKEKFTSTEPTEDKEREIWVELKRLFEPDTDDELWKLKKHIHDNLTWKLYDSCGVYHVSTEDGIDIYMLVKKEYPLSRRTLTLMLVVKLLVEQDSEMSRELLRKFMQGDGCDKWLMTVALLSMRTRMFFQKTRLKITINRNAEELVMEAGFDGGAIMADDEVPTNIDLMAFLDSKEEPKRVAKALSDSAWVEAMQEELLQFKLQKGWVLVDLPKGKRAIGTKWIFINKKNERGIVIRNKARMVAQGHTQEEGIDYDEVFALVARIKAIRLFLAYASFIGFMVYQMDVKSAFLYGHIEEEVYVCQPPGFQDPDYPDKVYKVMKALYGLHQDPRAWYETLAKYLLDNGFHKGKIDQTLFIKEQNGDILLVQVYVDDIIFGSTKKEMCTEFEKLMHDKFQMSYMGELTFFLGFFIDVRTASTPMDTEKPLLKYLDGDDVDVHLYRPMIGSLMYLTSSRLDIMYLKGQPKLGLWYPSDSPFDLVAYSDSDYVGASLDRKSTIGGCQFLGCRLISWQCKKQTMVATSSTEADYVDAASCYGQGEGSTHPVESHHTPTSAPSTLQPPISPTTRRSIRQESMVSQPRSPTQTPVADETVHEERGDNVERVATTAARLDAEQDSVNIIKTQSTAIPNEPFPQEIGSGVNTLGSDEGSLKLQELTILCTKLSTKVDSLEADLKQTKQIYGAAFTKLIKKVKTLEKTVKSSQAKRNVRIVLSDDEEDLEDPSKQGRMIVEIDEDPDISLVQHDAKVHGRHEHDMEPDFEFTTAEEVYTTKKGVTTAKLVSTAGASSTKDKGKAIMEEVETIQTKTKLQLEQKDLGEYTHLFQSESERVIPELAAGSSKRDAEEELVQENRDDELWKLQKHIHDKLTWKLYDSCGVHHVSTEDGIDIYMLVEREYPLSRGNLTLMLVAKLLVEQDSKMSRELLRKIFMQVEIPRR
ncbi:putative ribonuclease H-like domain-containing protein [Tanacetum coccineum]